MVIRRAKELLRETEFDFSIEICEQTSPDESQIHRYDRNIHILRDHLGKTAFEIAKEAFLYHVSQQNDRYAVEIDGPCDIRRYGLAYTAVGPDEAHDGLFEHLGTLYEHELSLKNFTKK